MRDPEKAREREEKRKEARWTDAMIAAKWRGMAKAAEIKQERARKAREN